MKTIRDIFLLGKVTSESLQNIKDASLNQSGHARSPAKEQLKVDLSSRKRGYPFTHIDDEVPKKLHRLLDSDDKLCDFSQTYQYRNHYPHRLIGLMYQLDLSVLCSLRKVTYEHKYSSLSLAFEDTEIDKFNNIVLRYKKKSIHIQIENVVKYYIDNDISYAKLFTKEKRNFSINNYLESFVKCVISNSDSILNNIEYLIIYTNSSLDLTEEKKLKQGRSRNFYPLKFNSINIEKCDILKDFLFTNDNKKGREFYQFAQDKSTREMLLKKLKFSSALKKVINERKLSEEGIKEEFLDKLVFAVNQPNREELNRIIKNEIEKNSKVQYDYTILQKQILRELADPEKLGNYIPGIIYEFNLLMFFLNDMFMHKNTFSINSERKSQDISNDITIHYKDKITYVKAYTVNSNIGYNQLFSTRKREEKNTFNKHFTHFIEELQKDTKYFIIYTNAYLDLTEENRLNKRQSKNFYPLKFNIIDIRKKKYKFLRNCLCINENGLYQFSRRKTTRKKLLSLLKLPPSLQKEKEEGRLSNENEKVIKEIFLDKLIFAVNQPNNKKLKRIIKNVINKSNKISYNYEELHEIALRWSESHESGPITKDIMKKLLEDLRNNRFSYQEIQNKNITVEIKLARSVVGKEGTSAFYQFLDFLIKREGKKYLEVLKTKRINLANMSSILHGAGANAIKSFKDLYELWFDEEGNKKQYLKTLEEEGINLANLSSILHGARFNAAKAFKDLFDLWFDQNGEKTKYLRKLEENGVDLFRMSSILSGSGANAPKSFKDLYDLWFDKKGNRTQYLKTLEKEGINLPNMSSILGGAGTSAPKDFKDLYDVWFDKQGNKTQYLNTLEKEGINLPNMSSILHRAGTNAAKAFKDLYGLWFDEKRNKTQYLKTLENEGINLPNMSSILGGAGTNAPKSFKDLYDLWFDKQGNKKQCLVALEENGINLSNMTSILSGAGANAGKAFEDLYNLWFDKKGNKTKYLKTIEKEGINLTNMSSILHRAGANATKAFKDLYNLWFDKQGNETQYLKTLEKAGISLPNMSSILHGVGAKAPESFKELYGLLFDEEGNKTHYLKTLEKQGINPPNMFCILGGAGAKAPKAFKDLYDLWFDDQGNKKQHLKHFTEKEDGKKSFTMLNLSSILGGTGAKAKEAVEKLHGTCFNDKGERTKILEDFYNAGFRPSSLSCILCKTGVRASSILERLHGIFFNEEGEKSKLLDDFYNTGFRPGDLCSILSAAADNLEKFHEYCFIGETKKYLKHFLREGFIPKNLSNILHGARANICSALKDFHDVCFDETGNKTQLLDDLYNAGFRLSDLSGVLTMAGNNTTTILKNFHKSCFNKNYLNHFLAEKELFTTKNLSKILHGVGINISLVFEKLHDLCFDKAGNKTDYLNNLIENNQLDILNILYKKVRKAHTTFLDDIFQQDINRIEEGKIDDPSYSLNGISLKRNISKIKK